MPNKPRRDRTIDAAYRVYPEVPPAPGQLWCDVEGELGLVTLVDQSYVMVRWAEYEDLLLVEDLCELVYVGEFVAATGEETVASKFVAERAARAAAKEATAAAKRHARAVKNARRAALRDTLDDPAALRAAFLVIANK